MNVSTLLVLVIVAIALYFAIRHVRKNKGSCDCGCANCPSAHNCQSLNNKEETT